MSDHSKADQVASGAPYRVTSVDGSPVDSLDDIPEADVVVIIAAFAEQEVTIHGSSRRVGDAIVVHEKTRDGIGKDVRTWEITGAVEDGIVARERSMF